MSPAQRVGALAVGLAGALLGLPAGAEGQSLDEAERLYRDGRLDEALAAFESLRQRGGERRSIASGSHTMRLVWEDGRSTTARVAIRPGETTSLRRDAP